MKKVSGLALRMYCCGLLAMSGQNVFASLLVPKDAVEIQLTKELENKMLGVRLEDFLLYHAGAFNNLYRVNEILKKDLAQYLPKQDVEVVHNLYLSEYPKTHNGIFFYTIQAFVEYKNKTYGFEKFVVSSANDGKSLKEFTVNLIESIDLKDTNFHFETSLVDRKVILKDDAKDIKMVFPIGVGAFDQGVINEGITSLVTPRFTNGFIPKSSVISKREMPRYFAGKPFIRIHDGEKRTEIGFHIEINDYFNRGFDSHGCMRLREADLQAMHDLVMFNAKSAIPVVVKYHIQDEMDHPAKLNNKFFKTVQNKGTKEDPFFILDRDNLVQIIYRDDIAPPIDQLIDESGDNYYEVFNYNTQEQLKEQNTRRSNKCKEQVQSIEKEKDRAKEFEKCMDEGKRKGGVGDWFYRKWVHG